MELFCGGHFNGLWPNTRYFLFFLNQDENNRIVTKRLSEICWVRTKPEILCQEVCSCACMNYVFSIFIYNRCNFWCLHCKQCYDALMEFLNNWVQNQDLIWFLKNRYWVTRSLLSWQIVPQDNSFWGRCFLLLYSINLNILTSYICQIDTYMLYAET